MKISEMLTAIQEYATLKADYEVLKAKHDTLKTDYEALRKRIGDVSHYTYKWAARHGNLGTQNYQLSVKVDALEKAFVTMAPRINSIAQYRRLYNAIKPYLDPNGFALYRTACKLTRFDLEGEFATEDSLGRFTTMDGFGLMQFLTASRFGSMEYAITPQHYEVAVRLHTDYDSPAYKAFEKKLYEETLRGLGFGKLLPKERAPQKDLNRRKEKGKVEER